MFGGGPSFSKANNSSTPVSSNGTGVRDAATTSPLPHPSPSSSPVTVATSPARAEDSLLPKEGVPASGEPLNASNQGAVGEKRSGNGSPPARADAAEPKKRRSSAVGNKASSFLASAKNTLNFAQAGARTPSEFNLTGQNSPQKLGKQDAALPVTQEQHNNSAGESMPGPRSTFRVGVWEDRNKKCRRTMEDTHAFLYNFLHHSAPGAGAGSGGDPQATGALSKDAVETDNGYFAIFDGHAGTFAADWCGKKLHLILEETIRRNPHVPIPELLDQTFTAVDAQLEKLPVKNSGCTAAIAVLRWEDRVPSSLSATGSQPLAAARPSQEISKPDDYRAGEVIGARTTSDMRTTGPVVSRQRVLYTANVGDARIILCRSGRALRLSYDHKGSDENEGRRIANAGGLILNNRVNGVLAVTRALGDTYMKDLVTGHPYTTETVIQPELDEFIILACDGLWDVCDDQEAVDQVRSIQDPAAAAKLLVNHALARFSTDNLSCMIVRFDKHAILDGPVAKEPRVSAESDSAGGLSGADGTANTARQTEADGGVSIAGLALENESGQGNDSIPSIQEDTPAAVAQTG